jgi:hypothetical protein
MKTQIERERERVGKEEWTGKMVCNPSFVLRCGKCEIGGNFVHEQEGEKNLKNQSEKNMKCKILT